MSDRTTDPLPGDGFTLRPWCPACGGEGVQPLSHGYSERTCPECNGTRRLMLDDRALTVLEPDRWHAAQVRTHQVEALNHGLPFDAARAWGKVRANGADRATALEAAIEA